jgi:predicted peptidase
MKASHFFIYIALWIFILNSCSPGVNESGIIKVPKKASDSILLKKRIAEIKAVDNNIFETYSFKGKGGLSIKYRLLKPNQSKTKLPLVIVFHGSNAIGEDNVSQLGILAKMFAMKDIQQEYPAFILAPQFPSRSSNYVMDDKNNVLTSVAQPCLQISIQLIDSLKKTLNIDEKRIYAVGFSMGASSVINVLSMRPDLFAGGISISGIPQFDQVNQLSNIPIWLIHGGADTENPINSDREFYKQVNIKNKTRFWEFENTAHNDIFSLPILNKELPKWLFGNKKQ